MKIITLVVFWVIYIDVACVFSKGGGSCGGLFLRLSGDNRAAALGSAYVGLADTPGAIFYNPAGISQLPHHSSYLMHTNYIDKLNISSEYLSHIYKINDKSSLGGGLIYLHTVDTRREKEAGKEIGEFSNKELSFNLAYSTKFNKNMLIGVAGKYIHSKLAEYKAQSIALDTGFLYKNIVENLNLGVVLENLGLGLKYIDELSPLPINIKAGIAYQLPLFKNTILAKGTLTTISDIILQPIERNLSLNLGFEYNMSDILRLRLGFKDIFDRKKAYPGLSCGIGIGIFNYRLDYTYSGFGEFGNIKRFSATVNLKPEIKLVERTIERVIERVIEKPIPPAIEKPQVIEKPPIVEKPPVIEKPQVIEKPPITEKLPPPKKPSAMALSCYAHPYSFIIDKETTTFYIDAKSDIDIANWELTIIAEHIKGEKVKTFKGRGLPPKKITWAGKDDNENALKVGKYIYKCRINDIEGNEIETLASDVFINKEEIKIIEKPEGIFITLIGEILFDKGSARLRPEAYSILKEVSYIIKENLDKQVIIEGHTCNLPLKSGLVMLYGDNFGLSKARAETVASYLTKLGIPSSIIKTIGYGDTRPVASNETEEGRKENRRVEIIIMRR